jgi:glycosyltransferase involved in cell wall biosynthesis
MPIGGTETFHRSLLPRLKKTVEIAGFVATGFHGGDGEKLQVPYATGINAARRLAEHCEVVVVWGINSLVGILPCDRPKVIAVHHGDWSSDWSNNLVLDQLNLIDTIVCVNAHTAIKLAETGKPVWHIPNAIDPDRLVPSGQQLELLSRWGIAEGARIVLFAHRLSGEKQPHMAVRIAKELPHNWVMVIAGDGPERESVQEAAAGCDRVRVVGSCDTLADWLALSHCFLSLSTHEGFGLSVGEAMAAGIPTVSTPTGIANEWATTLQADSTESQWAETIVNATVRIPAHMIRDQFSVERMVASWQHVIHAVASTETR